MTKTFSELLCKQLKQEKKGNRNPYSINVQYVMGSFFKTQKNVLPDSENKRRNYMTEKMRMAEQALEQGKGILRLAPTWVPRSFCRPGKRINSPG